MVNSFAITTKTPLEIVQKKLSQMAMVDLRNGAKKQFYFEVMWGQIMLTQYLRYLLQNCWADEFSRKYRNCCGIFSGS